MFLFQYPHITNSQASGTNSTNSTSGNTTTTTNSTNNTSLVNITNSATTWNDSDGCLSQPIPCSGNGMCTNTTNCICDLFYTGDNCEITVITSSRAVINATGISTGLFVAIILLWMAVGITGITILVVLWVKVWKEKKKAKKVKAQKTRPTPVQIQNTDASRIMMLNDTKKDMSPNETNFDGDARYTNLRDVSLMINNNAQSANYDVMYPNKMNITEDDISYNKSGRRSIRNNKENEVMSNQVSSQYNSQAASKGSNEISTELDHSRTPLADDLFYRVSKYQMKGLNTMEGYTPDSQKFILEHDNFRDLPYNIGQNLLVAENPLNRTGEIRDDTEFERNHRMANVIETKSRMNSGGFEDEFYPLRR